MTPLAFCCDFYSLYILIIGHTVSSGALKQPGDSDWTVAQKILSVIMFLYKVTERLFVEFEFLLVWLVIQAGSVSSACVQYCAIGHKPMTFTSASGLVLLYVE